MKTNLVVLIILGVAIAGYAAIKTNTEKTILPDGSLSASPSKVVKPSKTATPTSTGAASSVTPTPTSTSVSTPIPESASLTDTPTPVVKTYTVIMQNLTYSPSSITVNKGDFVIFKNLGPFVDTVKVNGILSSNIFPSNQWTLNTSRLPLGTYTFVSTMHTYNPRGVITIQ